MVDRRRTHGMAVNCLRRAAVFLILGMSLVSGIGPVAAQSPGPVQLLTGRLEPGEVALYLLPDIQAGRTLYAYAKGTSGDLDPIVGIVDAGTDPETLLQQFRSTYEGAVAGGEDSLTARRAALDRYLLAWDDDGGGGLTASLEFAIPAQGDYRLMVFGSISAFGGVTSGEYQLLVGLDERRVLGGEAKPAGAVIAKPDISVNRPGTGIQEISGTLTPEKTATFVWLNDFRPGDTFYAYVEATSGDLVPALVLNNFSRKPVRNASPRGTATHASLEYTFPVEGRNYMLQISGGGNGQATNGDYRLLVGVNAPEVMTGQADGMGREVVRKPIEVKAGVKLEQIVEINQANEFFTAVATLRLEWTDPALAFNPEDCQCDFQTFTGKSLDEFIDGHKGRWPEFTVQNQQGNRWAQNRVLVVFSNGHAFYLERFTTNFQVDFNFEQYPFDTQTFWIRVDSLYPEEYFVYAPLEGFSEINPEHGEDEFVLTTFSTVISTQKNSNGAIASRFTFEFQAPRHLSYYVFQIFVPILLIITVSWVTFFLKDYGRRIEVASANLLLFIAFSWSLADNYPRLGYLTFLDAIMAIMFVVNALVVVYNVWLKRLEGQGRVETADRIDSFLDWLYPVVYVVAIGVVVWKFF